MRPAFLYKFQAINKYSLENFANHQIYLNYPCKFDDPYDSALNIISLTEDDIIQFWDMWKEHKTLQNLDLDFDKDSQRWQKNGEPSPEFITGLQRAAKDGLNQWQEEILNKWGMSCFSSIYDDILMWSHYTNGHKGVCIEFDATKEPFSNAFEVKYYKDIPRHKYADIIADSAPMQKLSQMFLVKANCWEHQAEWRLIGPKGDTAVVYDKSCITKVFFGVKSSRDEQRNVIKALDVDLAKYYIMQNDPDKFMIKPLSYTEWLKNSMFIS